MLADIERTRAGFASEREAILTAARDAAEQTRRAMLAAATQEAAALQAAARAAIDKQHDAAEQAWTERANLLAVTIAQRLLARLEGPAVNAAFLDWLLQEVRRLPENVRHAIAADGVRLEAVSAAPIGPSDQERCRQLIGDAFEGHPEITFQVDAALIAGLELRGPHLVVANSWRADLNRILSDLAHGKRP